MLGNVEFFKKLYAMKEKADAGLKNYLGVDVGQLKKEVADEYAKNPDANGKERFSTARRFLLARLRRL